MRSRFETSMAGSADGDDSPDLVGARRAARRGILACALIYMALLLGAATMCIVHYGPWP
jgi:hypothetical protein